jgi:hypothetical protein
MELTDQGSYLINRREIGEKHAPVGQKPDRLL